MAVLAWIEYARMRHNSERTAMIYQHEARGADPAITNAIDLHIQAEQLGDDGAREWWGRLRATGGSDRERVPPPTRVRFVQDQRQDVAYHLAHDP